MLNGFLDSCLVMSGFRQSKLCEPNLGILHTYIYICIIQLYISHITLMNLDDYDIFAHGFYRISFSHQHPGTSTASGMSPQGRLAGFLVLLLGSFLKIPWFISLFFLNQFSRFCLLFTNANMFMSKIRLYNHIGMVISPFSQGYIYIYI